MESVEYQTIPSVLENHASADPHKPAFIFRNGSMERFVLTRQQVWDYSRKFSAILRKKGVAKGDVVCNTLRNSPQRLISEMGTLTAGAVSMNGQICLADGSDFLVSLKKSQCHAVILDPDLAKGAFHILKSVLKYYHPETGEVVCPDVPSLKLLFSCPLGNGKGKRFFDLLDTETELFHEKISPTDVCHYFCTSGSTSFFKLVAYDHLNVLKCAKSFAETLGVTSSTILLNNRLLGWLGGYPSSYITKGCTRVMFDESGGRPTDFVECRWRMACYEKCDKGFTGTLALIELNDIRKTFDDGSELKDFSLRTVLTGGGAVTENQVKSALGNICDEVIIVYACTECHVITSRSTRKMEDYEEFNTGLPRPGFEIKIVDQHGNNVPDGQFGEIFMKPPHSARYYVDEPEMTSYAFRFDGWIRVGDIGKLNNEKNLQVIGRDKFSILRGTVVFYPHPIESFVRKCPGIKDVVILGVPDIRLHEEICAVVIKCNGSTLSDEDIRNFCDSQLANKDLVAPTPRHVIFVDAFPLTPTGKLDRKTLKLHACKQLNL